MKMKATIIHARTRRENKINEALKTNVFDGYDLDEIIINELHLRSPNEIDKAIKMLMSAKYCFYRNNK